jgi:hypothetical protein
MALSAIGRSRDVDTTRFLYCVIVFAEPKPWIAVGFKLYTVLVDVRGRAGKSFLPNVAKTGILQLLALFLEVFEVDRKNCSK